MEEQKIPPLNLEIREVELVIFMGTDDPNIRRDQHLRKRWKMKVYEYRVTVRSCHAFNFL